METARSLVARRLPDLMQFGGTTEPSVSNERLCAQYMHPWPNFEIQMLEACNALDLSHRVSLTDAPEGESYFVGSKLGLTTRFAVHVCDAVAKALSSTALPLKFGDLQAVSPHPDGIPDVTLAIFRSPHPPSSRTATIIAAGELKTFWTLNLGEWTVNAPLQDRAYLEPFIGQVVSYMRKSRLRHGFLSTYEHTVFVKRDDDYSFHLSMPVSHTAVNPSLRECFVGFAITAAQNPRYQELHALDERLLRSPTTPGEITSMRPSPYRSRSGDPTQSVAPGLGITSNSIIIGRDSEAVGVIECVKLLSHPRLGQHKAVFEVQWGGVNYIAKCWSPAKAESGLNELVVYDKLYQLRPSGFGFFTELVFFGDIICSAKFTKGTIMLLKKVPGRQLADIWASLSSAEKIHTYSECSTAIRTLRSISICSLDAGMHNILFDRDTGTLTFIDFEVSREVHEPEIARSLNPELAAIFGFRDIGHLIHGG